MFKLVNKTTRIAAKEAIDQAPDGWTVTIKAPKRSEESSAMMWALIDDISDQVEWYNTKLCPSDWKAIFTASLRRQHVIPGLDGELVVVAGSTRDLTTKEMSDLIELITSFGVERGVKFKAPRSM